MRLVVALFLLVASPVWAGTVTVRSGNHDGFSRLVFHLSAPVEWSLETDDLGAVLMLGAYDELDVSTVFQRMDRTRIRGVNPARKAGAIRISFDCPCVAKSFAVNGKMIVVDVKEDPEARPEKASVTQNRPPVRLRTGILPLFTGPNQMRKSTGENDNPAPLPKEKAGHMEIGPMERDLSAQLNMSVSQGFLRKGAEAEDQIPVLDEESSDEDVPVSAHFANVRTSNATSTDANTAQQVVTTLAQDYQCLDADLVAVQDWTDGTDMTLQVGKLRADMYKEFDELNQHAALRLAKLFLHFGFGAEAKQVLLQIDEENTKVLIALANILDGTDEDSGLMQPQCDGAIAFWAMLSGTELSPEMDFSETSVLRAFDDLPFHLQTHLAARFVDRLMQANETETAGLVLNRMDRLQTETTPELVLADANVDLVLGNADEGEAGLSEVALSGDALAPRALIDLIKLNVAKGTRISDQNLALISAYETEYQDTELARELTFAYGLALASVGETIAALDTAASFDDDALENKEILVSNAVMQLAKSAQIDQLTKTAMSNRALILAHGDDPAQEALAERLLDAGFPELSLTFLSPVAEGELSKTQKLMRARAALMNDDPRQAEIELIGLNDPMADKIRAKARADAGDFVGALAVYSENGDARAVQEISLQAGRWADLTEAEDPTVASAARKIVASEAADQDVEIAGPLEASELLLSDSQELRSVLANLVQATEMEN